MVGTGGGLRLRLLRPPAIVLAAVGAYGLLDHGRDPLVFFLCFILAPILVVAAAVLAVRGAWVRERRGQSLSWSVALLLLAGLLPTVGYTLEWPRDRLRLLAWWAWDRAGLEQPGVVGEWEAWGFAGMTNVAFLVVEPDDALTLGRAIGRWGDGCCDVVKVRRLREGLFVVTTMNCGLR